MINAASAFRSQDRIIDFAVYAFSIAISFFPLIFNLPFRGNIYLSFEGAYRIAQGEVPFEDFYMPFGYGYFMFLSVFFKLLGYKISSLLWGQAFMNLILLIGFYYLLLLYSVKKGVAFTSTVVMGLSYTFLFFWPWYNHSAFFYNFLGLLFASAAILKENKTRLYASLAGFCAFLSFFTKQDYGGLSILSVGALMIVDSIYSRSITKIGFYVLSLVGSAVILITPVYNEAFRYWFNVGQPPHQSRLELNTFLTEIFGGSEWEKFFLLVVGLLLLSNFRQIVKDKKKFLFYFLMLIIIGQTLVTKVTSRLPSDTTTYFWGFFFAFLLNELFLFLDFQKLRTLSISIFLVFLVFSAKYWSYANRIFKFKSSGKNETAEAGYKWQPTPFKSFSNVYMPEPTIKGIEGILSLPLPSNPKVLNMSELTMLSEEIPYTPEKKVPLWYHLNIGMFEDQVQDLQKRIEARSYDLVLFEDIPNLDNFYPYRLRDQLRKDYILVNTFPAPRNENNSFIEVYLKKQ